MKVVAVDIRYNTSDLLFEAENNYETEVVGLLNELVNTAVSHGGDYDGPYRTANSELLEVMENICERFGG